MQDKARLVQAGSFETRHVLQTGDVLPRTVSWARKAVRSGHEEAYQFNRDTVLPAKFVLVALESK